MSAAAAAVTRFCFVRLGEAGSAGRAQRAAQLADALARACAPHPVWVGIPADDSAARWDLAITIALPSLEDWQQLHARPEFAAELRALEDEAVVSKAWTFAAAGAPGTSSAAR